MCSPSASATCLPAQPCSSKWPSCRSWSSGTGASSSPCRAAWLRGRRARPSTRPRRSGQPGMPFPLSKAAFHLNFVPWKSHVIPPFRSISLYFYFFNLTRAKASKNSDLQKKMAFHALRWKVFTSCSNRCSAGFRHAFGSAQQKRRSPWGRSQHMSYRTVCFSTASEMWSKQKSEKNKNKNTIKIKFHLWQDGDELLWR